MSDEQLNSWRQAVGVFGARLAEVSDAHLDAPTPCTDWAVADLLSHVFEVQTRTPSALGASMDLAAPRTAEGWELLIGQAEQVLAAPGRLGETVMSGFGEMPAAAMLSVATADCLTHTWDLSRALGVDHGVPDDAASAALEFMRPLDELLRGPGMLAAKIAPPDGADAATQLACFAGRDPAWRPIG